MLALKSIKSLVAFFAISIGVANTFAQAAFPERPIKIIVPTNPGGSVDTVARTIARSIEQNKLLPVKMVALNLPGAGGTIGTRKVKSSPADGYTIGIWHLGLVTSRAMNIVDYDHTAFELIGSTGFSEIGIGAGPKSKIQDFDQMAEISRSKPLNFATNIGLPVHILPMIYANEAGLDFKFVQVGGASQRLASLLGGHADLGIFSIPEFINYQKTGIRPVVLFTKERNDKFPDIPTALEQEIDLNIASYYLWILPKGTPEPIKTLLTESLREASNRPEVVEQLQEMGMVSKFREGSELEDLMSDILVRSKPLISKMGLRK